MTNDAQLLAELERQHAAQALLHEYQRLVDAKDIDGLAEIVVPDVVLARQDGESRGAEQFLNLYRKFAASDVQVAHHMVTNVEARELPADGDARVVRVDSCFLAITTHASGEARFVWGRYSDDMVRTAERWKIAAKRIAVVRTAFVDSLAPLAMNSFGPRQTEDAVR
ncbi:MAG TPA: nuclear transport factor 2 family protein [Nocardioides sp.]|uniref:nuclear transport factor 2 family protein n=1 Tax=Nocardioides sp. TaxID=35761 RepID=UPI002BE35469|nr:nuclear transport factor 2 family protein [Nocardioides sp.]HTW18267.1 nuclear transport factor 2 family protein [Nocardioides sp.]